MNKKKIVFWSIIAIVVILLIVFVKVSPMWVSLSSLVALVAGAIIGWVGKIFYDKYIAPVKEIVDKVTE